MRTFELTYSEADPQAMLERFCSQQGLTLSKRFRLASYPGSVHWHLSSPLERGTLEATWWPDGKRFWLKIASNRDALWIDEVAGSLQSLTNGYA